jgi:hypothetical protein
MCYFLSIEVTPQKRQAEAQNVVERLAKSNGLYLQGEFPVVQVTDGHCSCHQVATDGRALHVTTFLEELLKAEEIKNIKVGWIWASGKDVQMQPETVEQRLSIQEFLTHNAAGELLSGVWYRLHDPDKYKRKM